MQAILSAISLILGHGQAIVSAAPIGVLSAIFLFVSEFVMKLWPTANPKGWLLAVDVLCKKLQAAIGQIGAIIAQIGDICVKLDGLISQLVPQNVAPVQPPK